MDLVDSKEAQDLYDSIIDLLEQAKKITSSVKVDSTNEDSKVPKASEAANHSEQLKSIETADSISEQPEHQNFLERMGDAYELLVDLETKTKETLANYKQKLATLDEDRAASGQQILKQLEITHSRVTDLREQLESGTVELSEESVTNTEQKIIEIEKNLAEFQKAYNVFYRNNLVQGNSSGAPVANRMDIISDFDLPKPLSISVVEKKNVEPARGVVEPLNKNVQSVKKESLSSLRSDSKKYEQYFIVPKHLIEDLHLKEILREHQITWQEVDRNLKKTIIDVEKPSQLDVFLRVRQGSVYKDLLAPMTIEELSRFERRSLEEIAKDLADLQKQKGQQYEYRIYRAWLNMFDDMAAVTPIHKETTFGEMCALFEIIKLMPDEEVEEM